MCSYCKEINDINYFEGSDGILHDLKLNDYYLVVWYFKHERTTIHINHCPKCGRKLKE
jgi:hypothetical protein